ncbi:MAG: hypothetical protein Q9163_004461 [Psora crenata]
MANTFIKRTTSPLHFESAAYAPEDVICPGSEEESSSGEQSSRKRRRVEIAGRGYLNGRGLFIQTAILKGPLENGWVNPWARSRSARAWEDIRRYPKAGKDTAADQHMQTIPHEEPVTSKRRAKLSDHLDRVGDSVTGAHNPSGPANKRRRRGELDRINAQQKSSSKKGNKEWLKTTDLSHQPSLADSKSLTSTPTPAPKDRSYTVSSSPRPSPQPHHSPDTLHKGNGSAAQHQSRQPGGFTSINRSTPRRKTTALKTSPPQNNNPSPDRSIGARSNEISSVEGGDAIRGAYKGAKRRSQEAIRSVQKADGYLPVRKLSQEAATKAIAEHYKGWTSRLAPYIPEATNDQDANDDGKARNVSNSGSCTRKTPASTTPPGIKYRVAGEITKPSSGGSKSLEEVPEQVLVPSSPYSASPSDSEVFSKSADRASRRGTLSSPAALSLKHDYVKTRVRPGTMRRLSSTQKIPPSNFEVATTRTSTKSSDKPLIDGSRSKSSSNILPEAQVVPDVPLPTHGISGPSTNLLETDRESPKLPVFEECDSYINQPTQAAFLKAHHSFKDDVLANLKTKGPDVDQKKPSTQRMADKTPLPAITTIEKRPPSPRKRASIAPTPTKAKARTPATSSMARPPFLSCSPNKSTSLEASPPRKSSKASDAPPDPTPKATASSTLTSFSILPNGTLTETSVVQDGQQPQQPVRQESYASLRDLDFGNPPGTNSSGGANGKSDGSTIKSGRHNLDDAIEDAGSFLGEWNVETEARKVGADTNTGSSKPGSLGKSILSRRKGRGRMKE